MAKVKSIMEASQFRHFKKGDEKAFAYFFNAFYEKIVGFCLQFVKDKDKSNSIAQEAFIKLWLNREKVKKINGIKSFLYTAAKSECLNFLRHDKVVKTYESRILNERENQLNIDVLNSFNFNKLLLHELEDKIEQSIEELPAKCKLVYIKSRQEKKKNKEISEELGISVKAVEANITRALKYLKLKLSDYSPTGAINILLLLFLNN